MADDQTTPDTGDIVAALHLRTTNDTSGNPRRVFVGLDSSGHVVRVTDEGYYGRPEWVRALNARGTWELPVNVTPREYRERIRQGASLAASDS